MVLEMIKRYIKSIIYSVILLGLLGVPLSVAAQQELTREERIKILEQLKMEDKKIEVNTLGLISPKTSIDIEKLELPPLSVFLDAVTENASVKRAQSQVEQLKNQYRLEKRNWWNYFRLNGNYSYGRYNIIGNASDEFTPMYQTTMSSAQHNFNVGASFGITLGDLFNRPLKLKDYLRENRLTAGTPLEVTWISEDWDSIAALVKQSDMMFREATLDLIGNVDIDKGRERMLMRLADGKPYKYLAEKIFPEVMRVDYRIEYTRQPLDAAESLRLFRTGERRALRLNEFFTVAGSYPQGSTEYNDVLDLAARLFPDSPEANINAAAVALIKGETAKARRYLERFATLPMAYNNMGILCLQEGNRDKAEVYLTMAAAAGVKQADKALKELKRQAGN